jgi:hypothetical protein
MLPVQRLANCAGWDASRSRQQHFYSFRHHAITKLLENPDVSEETAKAIAGHISHRMEKRYSHIRIQQKRAAIAVLSRIEPDSAAAPISQQPQLTNGDVVAMLKDLPAEIVIAKIKAGPCHFNIA